MHEENKKSFLEELQSLDETVKRRVAMIATAVIMIGVVYVWLGYFNGLVVGASEAQAAPAMATATGAPAPNAGSSSNISQDVENIKSGMATIGSDFAGLFSHPGKYTVQPSQ